MLYPLSYEGGTCAGLCAGLAADPHVGVLRVVEAAIGA